MFVHDQLNYYLSEVNDTATQIVWTRQKMKCKKYASSNDAVQCMEKIKLTHNSKTLSVTQA